MSSNPWLSQPVRYIATIDWTDPETGKARSHTGEFLEISVGKAGRLMTTQTDGISLNFAAFDGVRIDRVIPTSSA
jgi:hypothetical protein